MNLSVENGCYKYKNGDKTVLNSINFSVNSGDLLAILGPNGAGKTTLLRCLTGFLKWQSGSSKINGEDIASMNKTQLWQTVSYVPQARLATAAYSVHDMILLGRASYFNMLQKPKKSDYDAVERIINQMGLSEFADKKCSQISGGELQLTLIARALAAEPKILILDEPESNLDFKNQLVVLNTMSSLAQGGMICIFNTHYPAHALQRANKALMLCKNGEFSFGNAKSIISESSIEKAFGVRAALGEIETAEKIESCIVPLEIASKKSACKTADEQKIAVISIITHNSEMSEKINEILHEYTDFLVGRMGMPYRKAEIYIINVTVDAPQSIINEIASQLNIQQNISVKITYA